jgi:DNA-binding transcriptional MerR regulator
VTPKLYKAGEVCEAAGLQPYVLRSWEKEFPGIGVQRSPDSPRLYRQSDLDQVLRIKQLVFGEGLTLAGARRRLEESSPRPADDEVEMAEVIETLGADARARIAMVRHGLRSLLEVLSKVPGTAEFEEFRLSPPITSGSVKATGKVSASRASAPGRAGGDRKAVAKTKIIAKRTPPKPQASAKRKRASA